MQLVPVTLETPVTFGKYKGQPMAVLLADAPYCHWMMGQPDFADRYPGVAEAIKHGTAPAAQDCTPEHNKLQMLFLKPEYQIALVNARMPAKSVVHREYMAQARDSLMRQAVEKDSRVEMLRDTRYDRRDEEIANATKEAAELRAKANTHECDGIVVQAPIIDAVQFEQRNWDVVILADRAKVCGACQVSVRDHTVCLEVELKPNIGEDYPAVLRKVKQRNSRYDKHGQEGYKVVVAGEFTARSATIEQVKQMFRASGIRLLLLSDLWAVMPAQEF